MASERQLAVGGGGQRGFVLVVTLWILAGVAIVVAFSLVVAGAALVGPSDRNVDELLVVLGIALGLAFMGLLDDLRSLSPLLRLVIEVGAAVVVWSTAEGTSLFQNQPLDLLVTGI